MWCASGKHFLGWGLSNDFGRVANQDAATTTYTVGRGNVVLTAYCGDYQTMQNFTATNAAAMSTGETRTLKDARDGQEYTVAKLADGKVWMTQNLRLDLTAVSLATLQGNTNASDTTLSYLKNGGGSGQYPANGVIAKTASGGSWADDFSNPYIATEFKNSGRVASGSAPAGIIGIYYNYCAASAGSYCYELNDNPTSDNTNYNICPAGWRMPTGGPSGEYENLYITGYNSNVANFEAALSTPLSGNFTAGSGANQGVYGHFWSSTYYGANSMYVLRTEASAVSPQSSFQRHYGFSVRCIFGN